MRSLQYLNQLNFMNRRKNKKPAFKNPFDIEDEDDEVIPIRSYPSEPSEPEKHHPLPFNPYTIESTPAQKNSKKVEEKGKEKQVASQGPKAFVPKSVEIKNKNYQKVEKVYELNEDGDPPLLADIGIDPEMIKKRIMMVLKIEKPSQDMIEDPDLSGPTLIALCFGILLLLTGKVHFGDIYAIFIFGNFLLYFLFNFMSQVEILPLYNVMSTVGYSLLPMLILGLVGVFLSLKTTSGILLSFGIALWSSVAASNIMESLMKQTNNDRKLLLVYPMFLFYLSFAMIVIF